MHNEPITRLLLDHGATPNDHDLYNAGFAADPARCLRVLMDHGAQVAELAEQALAAPISINNLQAVQVLLEAGADPGRYRDDAGRPAAVVPAALAAGDGELIELLLSHGADPDASGRDGRSAYRVATARGQSELMELLRHHGARDDATAIDRVLYACRRSDGDSAHRVLAEHSGLLDELTDVDAATIVTAAESGAVHAVRLMLDLGVPVDARGGDRGETALHAAAYVGSTETVGVVGLLAGLLLRRRGADRLRWYRVVYRLAYRLGLTVWQRPRPSIGLGALVEGPSAFAPGRALDLGCGTGTTCLHRQRVSGGGAESDVAALRLHSAAQGRTDARRHQHRRGPRPLQPRRWRFVAGERASADALAIGVRRADDRFELWCYRLRRMTN